VTPTKLEGLLVSHPEILDVVISHAQAGEVPVAYFVRSPNSSLIEEGVKKFIAKQIFDLAKTQNKLNGVLKIKVSFINVVPKTTSGKILRRELIEKVRSKI
ncbi:4-coumarate--CoA ligase-like 7, partial [Glycine soja]